MKNKISKDPMTNDANFHATQVFCKAVKTFINAEARKQTSMAEGLGAIAFGMGNAAGMAMIILSEQMGLKLNQEHFEVLIDIFGVTVRAEREAYVKDPYLKGKVKRAYTFGEAT